MTDQSVTTVAGAIPIEDETSNATTEFLKIFLDIQKTRNMVCRDPFAGIAPLMTLAQVASYLPRKDNYGRKQGVV
jgi:hypothetical protein